MTRCGRGRGVVAGLLAAGLLLGGCARSVPGSASAGGAGPAGTAGVVTAGAPGSITVPIPTAPTPGGPTAPGPATAATTAPTASGQGGPTGPVAVSSVAPTAPPASSPGAVTSGAAQVPVGGTVDPARFAARLSASTAGISSIIGTLSETTGGTEVAGSVSENLSAGKVSSAQMSLHVTAGAQTVTVQLLIVGGKAYIGGADILKALGVKTKWALANPASSNSSLAQLSTSFGNISDLSGADQYPAYAHSASNITHVGDENLSGVPAHKYTLTVDVAKYAAAAPSNRTDFQQLEAAGIKTLPVTLWLDDTDRPIRSTVKLTAAGQTVSVNFEVTAYNTKVTISAPAAADVYAK